MGSYRLLLALAVLFSHTGAFITPRTNQGVVAVVSFFVISGYVTTALIQRYYQSPAEYPGFLLDRSMRLFPQFLFYLAAAALVIWLAHGRFQWPELSPSSLLLNASMIPAGFYMYVPEAMPLNPPTWTLGLEFTFYLLMPLVLLKGLRLPAFIASIAVFVGACAGWLHPDHFGYRLLPGTLFMFLCGSFIRTADNRLLLTLTWLGALALALVSEVAPIHDLAIGLALGIPAVFLLQKARLGGADEALGNLSYGVYLNHFVLIWAAQLAGWPIDTWPRRLALIAAALVCAWVTYALIERPIVNLRHRLRNRPQAAAVTDAGLRSA